MADLEKAVNVPNYEEKNAIHIEEVARVESRDTDGSSLSSEDEKVPATEHRC